MKRCCKCKEIKTDSEFYRHRSAPDGLSYECGSCVKNRANEWYKKNSKHPHRPAKRTPEEIRSIDRVRARIFREENPDLSRQRRRKAVNAWAKKYPEKVRAKRNARFASQRGATPKWANKFFIEEAYRLAQLRTKMFGFKWHVDHIVPLRSRLVCGLHVENNLQILPEGDNLKKANKFWPDMPTGGLYGDQ